MNKISFSILGARSEWLSEEDKASANIQIGPFGFFVPSAFSVSLG